MNVGWGGVEMGDVGETLMNPWGTLRSLKMYRVEYRGGGGGESNKMHTLSH